MDKDLDNPITTKMKEEADQRRQLFISEVLYINDADVKATEASGWGIQGKVAWLKATCARYRKDLHKIFKD